MNFRATPALVDAASALIAHNAPHRTEKALRAHRRGPGLPPVLVHEEVCADEADAVVRALVAWRRHGLLRAYGDVALLLRSVKYHGEPYLEALDRHGVPYTVVADGGFFDREDVIQPKDGRGDAEAESGLLNLGLSGEAADEPNHERDQRRLFCVALTRAGDVLVVVGGGRQATMIAR